MTWKVFLASAAGKYHLDGNTPCEDAVHYALAGGGFVGVVCDGAGSAAQGGHGARFIARAITDAAAAAVRSGWLAQGTASTDHEHVTGLVAAARAELARLADGQQCALRDYACTLVACASTPAGGCFFHIGDGFAVHRDAAGASTVSLPENGEYADETYFVTDADWHEHLRLTPLPAGASGGLIGLMSDGTSPFAIDRGRTGFYGPFIDPVVRFLLGATVADGNQALHDVLASERTHAITADDKTLLLALAA